MPSANAPAPNEADRALRIPPALARVTQQPRVQRFLASAAQEGRLSHAYLFVGPPGAGKTEMARALAQCVVCPQGGDSSCDECIRVAHGTHPDVHVYAPASATGYLVAQVRELSQDVSLAPVRAHAKVYILRDVGLLRGASANALLKTIEEPPAGVMFILIARSVAQVLPTIASRCQQVPFRVIETEAAVRTVESKTGADETAARIALAVAGTPERAAAFLSSPDRRQVRRLVVRTLGELPRDDDWDVLVAARGIVEAVRAPLGQAKKDLEASEKENADYLGAAALKRLAEASKRELTARERSGMMEALAAVSSLLRDVLMRLEGVSQPITNADAAEVVDRLVKTSSAQGVLAGLDAVSRAADDLAHNVSPRLTFEVMLLRVKEALTCPPSFR